MTTTASTTAAKSAWLFVEPNEYKPSGKPPVCFQLVPNQLYPIMAIIHRIAVEKSADLFQVQLNLAHYDWDDMGLYDDDQFKVDDKGALHFEFAKRTRWWTRGSAASRYQKKKRKDCPPRILYNVRTQNYLDYDIQHAIHDPVNPNRKRLFSKTGLDWLRKNHPEFKRPCTIKLVVDERTTNGAQTSTKTVYTDEKCVIDTIVPWVSTWFCYLRACCS